MNSIYNYRKGKSMGLVENLEAMGWVIETEVCPANEAETAKRKEDQLFIEYFGRQAVLRHLPSTGKGPISPSEADLFLHSRFGAGGMTFRFKYYHLCGEVITLDVVPNIENNTASVRLVEMNPWGKETTTQWISILHVLQKRTAWRQV